MLQTISSKIIQRSKKILLGNDITILENLANLDRLVNVGEFEVIVLPANLQADTAPVRTIARVK